MLDMVLNTPVCYYSHDDPLIQKIKVDSYSYAKIFCFIQNA